MKMGDLYPNICQLITIGYQIYSFYQLQVVTTLQYLGFITIYINININIYIYIYITIYIMTEVLAQALINAMIK